MHKTCYGSPEEISVEESMHWIDGVSFSVVVCDPQGICLFANEHARSLFAKLGVTVEAGKNLVDCHKGQAQGSFLDFLANPRLATYTIDKGGQRLLVRREPFYEAGQCVGIVQLGFVFPENLPHVVHDP